MSIDYYFITCVQLNHFLLLPLRMQFLQDALQEIIKMEDKVSSLRADIQRKEEIVRSLQKKQKVVHFDEETIAEHDKERGTRMKIDEPPTPYVRDAPPVLDFPDIKDDNNVDPDIPLLPSVSLTKRKKKIVDDHRTNFISENFESEESFSSTSIDDETFTSPMDF